MGISFERALTVDGDLHGRGVNIAARLEQMAEPGEIYVCALIAGAYAAARPDLFEPLGLKWLKNMSTPVDVFRLTR
jgi:class 3 adenylate cyclase